MAQLLLGSRQSPTTKDQFNLACTAHLRRISRDVEGVAFVAALETSTGEVLHSINRSVDIDAMELSAAVCRLVRCHRFAQAAAQSGNPILDLMINTRRELHILRPLRREPLVALYLVVHLGPGRAARARSVLSDVARVLDTRPGTA